MTNKTQHQFAVDEDKPNDWFEPLYADANKQGEGVPWANMTTHPSFSLWLSKHNLNGQNKKAVVVGCGMGDDAIELEKLGFDVIAIDVSESAIAFCKARFPQSTVNFVQADLLQKQEQWFRQFDFVLEIYTVQALPPKYEQEVIKNIANFVANDGQLVVIAVVSQQERDFKNGPPWLLTPQHVESFESCGLKLSDAIHEPSDMNEDVLTYISTFEAN